MVRGRFLRSAILDRPPVAGVVLRRPCCPVWLPLLTKCLLYCTIVSGLASSELLDRISRPPAKRRRRQGRRRIKRGRLSSSGRRALPRPWLFLFGAAVAVFFVRRLRGADFRRVTGAALNYSRGRAVASTGARLVHEYGLYAARVFWCCFASP